MLNKSKMLEQKDTENRIQQVLGKASEWDSSISESVDQDSNEELLNQSEAEERGRQSDENEQKESSGKSTLNKITIMPEAVDKERVSDNLLHEESSSESVLGNNANMRGCCNAFDLMENVL